MDNRKPLRPAAASTQYSAEAKDLLEKIAAWDGKTTVTDGCHIAGVSVAIGRQLGYRGLSFNMLLRLRAIYEAGPEKCEWLQRSEATPEEIEVARGNVRSKEYIAEAKDLLEKIAAWDGKLTLRDGCILAGVSPAIGGILLRHEGISLRTMEKIRSVFEAGPERCEELKDRHDRKDPSKRSTPAPAPQKVAPTAPLPKITSDLTIDMLPRVMQVIEALGGLDRAEKIAKLVQAIDE